MAKKRKKNTTKRYQKQRQTQHVYINTMPQDNNPFSRIPMRILYLERQQATKQNEADWIGKRQNTALFAKNERMQETVNAAMASRSSMHAQLVAMQGAQATPSGRGGRPGGGGTAGTTAQQLDFRLSA